MMKEQSIMEHSKGNGEQDGGAKKISNLSEEKFEIRESPKRDLHEGDTGGADIFLQRFAHRRVLDEQEVGED